MTYQELKNDPSIDWVKEPIVGLTMTMAGNAGLKDSLGVDIYETRQYWVGKHKTGYLVILPVEGLNEVLNDDLRKNARFN